MTAIAYRDGWLAADRGIFDDNHLILGSQTKIVRLPDGWHLAMAGGYADGERVAKLLIENKDPSLAELAECGDAAEGILVSPALEVFVIGIKTGRESVCGPYVAVGALSDFLYGAMAVKATAQEAVVAACANHALAQAPVDNVWCGDGKRPTRKSR